MCADDEAVQMFELENVVRKLKSPMPEAQESEDSPVQMSNSGALRVPKPGEGQREAAIPIWIKSQPERVDGLSRNSGDTSPVPISASVAPFIRNKDAVMAEASVNSATSPVAKVGEHATGFGPVLTFIGAVSSIALVIGVSVWTYKLGQRDAMEVPVVKAMVGPSRMLPKDPGGLITPHQGLSVNRVLEGGGVRPVARKVVTAPGDGVLKDEDLPQAALEMLAVEQLPQARPIASRETTDLVGLNGQASADLPLTAAVAVAVEATGAKVVVAKPNGLSGRKRPDTVDSPELDIAPVRPVMDTATITRPDTPSMAALSTPDAPVIVAEIAPEAVDEPKVTDENIAPVDVVSLAIPAKGKGPRSAPVVSVCAMSRPKDVNATVRNAIDAAVETAIAAQLANTTGSTAVAKTIVATNDHRLDTIPLPTGTRMIQLGAFGSEKIALSKWEQFQRRNTDLLGGKKSYVQRTDVSGKIYYRLRVAGYGSKADTLAACSALIARNLECITVTLR